ncbi:hypothetical protein EV294_109131 [Paenibacillus sp. BK033]|nr:hypothetical protein EV294_109131 [Paenibacillus sp. BK033]
MLLVIASLIFIALSWLRTKNLKILPFYICIAGAVYILELVIFVLLNSYSYKPGILRNSFYDSAIGAIVSNGFIVPSTCTLIAVYRIRFRWILLIAAGFMAIEQSFIYLGVFEHHWWKLIYTGIGLILLPSMGKWLWQKLCQPDHPYLLRLVMLYIINVSLQGTIMSGYLLIFYQLGFRPGWFEDPARDNLAFATLIVHADSLLFACLVSLRGGWIWKAILFVTMGCVYWWLNHRDILYTSGIWLVLLLLLLQIVILQLLAGIHRIIAEKSAVLSRRES